ncbi:hypothetical protein CAI16_08560 [Virgibacillus dokdonensis]|uniref:Uncharacterized protein n=1 Tax=Virgibacillus dokdonensis TaxID=302167 RepID=A0A3E0WSB9_9BACI|nr:hypothetical protein CAI16_08560 [Virgibacillus dokdonensis]
MLTGYSIMELLSLYGLEISSNTFRERYFPHTKQKYKFCCKKDFAISQWFLKAIIQKETSLHGVFAF